MNKPKRSMSNASTDHMNCLRNKQGVHALYSQFALNTPLNLTNLSQPHSAEIIVLNVGGVRHEISWSKLEKISTSRLYRIRFAKTLDELRTLCDGVDLERNELFFDRSSKCFASILYFYQTGKLHLLDECCVIAFHEDLLYWGVDEYYFESCCHFRYYNRKENILEEVKRTEEVDTESDIEEHNGIECIVNLRRSVWNMMENPETSHVAKAIGFISVFFVLLSSLTFCLSTIKEFNINIINHFTHSDLLDTSSNNTSIIEHENPVTETIEIVCIVWFTFEFAMRFWGAPNRIAFMKSPLNFIDLISILPYYISLILENEKFKVLFYETNNIRVFRLFRIFRILRIFKLARHSDGLQSFGQTLQKSYNELGLLIMFLSITVLIFSSLAYFAEKDVEDTKFKSIPATFWWALITLTTVGYGDMYPHTFFGKVIGMMCCICGVLVISLPVPIIVNNFTYFYEEQKKRTKALKMKKESKQQIARGRTTSIGTIKHLISVNPLLNRSSYENFSQINLDELDKTLRKKSTVSFKDFSGCGKNNDNDSLDETNV